MPLIGEGPQVIESAELWKHLARDRQMRGHTYRNINFPGMRVERGDFGGATFERLTLTDCELDGADLQRTTWKQVDARRTKAAGALLARASVSDCDWTEITLRDALIEGITFERVGLGNADLERAKLSSVRFLASNGYGIKMPRAVIVRSTFHDPHPNGAAEMTRANLQNATLIDCDASHANFYRADFRGALVVRCNFAGAILTAAQVEGATFVGCNFAGADLPDGLRDKHTPRD